MTSGCTCPIYYQGVDSLEKGSVIIRYKLPELIQNVAHYWGVVCVENGILMIRYKLPEFSKRVS